MVFRILAWICLAWFSTSCQTPRFNGFEKVATGMDKSSVIELIGSPTKSRRWNGKDRWVYEFHNRQGDVQVREVHFELGRVTYSGPKVKAAVTAEEQDKVNEAVVSDESRQADEERDRRDQALGAVRPSKTAQKQKLDPLDRKLRESMYGIPADPEIEKRKQAPVFVPVE